MPENTEPADELPFRPGDTVCYHDNPAKTLTVTRHISSLVSTLDFKGWIPEGALRLVYRPPTKEEVEAMRERIAELEAALRAALATNQGEQA